MCNALTGSIRVARLCGKITGESGEVNSIRQRNTINDWKQYGCALVEDVVE